MTRSELEDSEVGSVVNQRWLKQNQPEVKKEVNQIWTKCELKVIQKRGLCEPELNEKWTRWEPDVNWKWITGILVGYEFIQ